MFYSAFHSCDCDGGYAAYSLSLLCEPDVKPGRPDGPTVRIQHLGAAAGSMLCGFWLIGRFGMTGTLGIAVAINMLIGLVCVGCIEIAKHSADSDDPTGPSFNQSKKRCLWTLVLLICLRSGGFTYFCSFRILCNGTRLSGPIFLA